MKWITKKICSRWDMQLQFHYDNRESDVVTICSQPQPTPGSQPPLSLHLSSNHSHARHRARHRGTDINMLEPNETCWGTDDGMLRNGSSCYQSLHVNEQMMRCVRGWAQIFCVTHSEYSNEISLDNSLKTIEDRSCGHHCHRIGSMDLKIATWILKIETM